TPRCDRAARKCRIGTARIVGSDRERIVSNVRRLIENPDEYSVMSRGDQSLRGWQRGQENRQRVVGTELTRGGSGPIRGRNDETRKDLFVVDRHHCSGSP